MRVRESHNFHGGYVAQRLKLRCVDDSTGFATPVRQVPGRERPGRLIQQPTLVRPDQGRESGGDVRPSPPGFVVKTYTRESLDELQRIWKEIRGYV